jgi:hypothetical protein
VVGYIIVAKYFYRKGSHGIIIARPAPESRDSG